MIRVELSLTLVHDPVDASSFEIDPCCWRYREEEEKTRKRGERKIRLRKDG
jgi:hypothetical protein